MLHGHIVDAQRQLAVAESWRYGKETAAQYQKSKLIQAYRSLLDYIIWCDRKCSQSGKAPNVYLHLCGVTLPPTGHGL